MLPKALSIFSAVFAEVSIKATSEIMLLKSKKIIKSKILLSIKKQNYIFYFKLNI